MPEGGVVLFRVMIKTVGWLLAVRMFLTPVGVEEHLAPLSSLLVLA